MRRESFEYLNLFKTELLAELRVQNDPMGCNLFVHEVASAAPLSVFGYEFSDAILKEMAESEKVRALVYNTTTRFLFHLDDQEIVELVQRMVRSLDISDNISYASADVKDKMFSVTSVVTTAIKENTKPKSFLERLFTGKPPVNIPRQVAAGMLLNNRHLLFCLLLRIVAPSILKSGE